jgi:5'-nucleotidase
MPQTSMPRVVAVVTIGLALTLGACSSSSGSGSGSSSSTASTTKAAAAPLTILVTNDDGYDAPGIDAVVEALRALPDVKVTVVAPATNQTLQAGKTTPGELSATESATASGYPATAVDGYPADTIRYALEHQFASAPPDVVVSGINLGPNLGPIVNVSGTVGAAKAAVARGIPAIAASAGIPPEPSFRAGARLVVEWVRAHREAFAAGGTRPTAVVNLNVPSCTSGSLRGVVQVPLSADGSGSVNATPDCTSTATDPTNDVAAFSMGFAPVTEIDQAGQTVTTSTTWPKR